MSPAALEAIKWALPILPTLLTVVVDLTVAFHLYRRSHRPQQLTTALSMANMQGSVASFGGIRGVMPDPISGPKETSNIREPSLVIENEEPSAMSSSSAGPSDKETSSAMDDTSDAQSASEI